MRTLRDVQRELETQHLTDDQPVALLKETCRILAAAADYDRLPDARHVHTTLDAIFAAYDQATLPGEER